MTAEDSQHRSQPFPHSGWGSWVFVVVAAAVMLQPFAEALPNHGADVSWPAHAQFHLAAGLANQFFLGFAAVLVARMPFRRGEAWSWWVLAGFALAMVCLIPATLWFGSGPARTFWPMIGAQILAMLAALVATAPMLRAR
ncbi:MAG: hypothetical protein V2J24_22465 [Pseudomonadales bacterium]|jgi:hypothetical protein|nr:hypothetical protein [Pseudomonadales bacterium]